MDSRTINRRLLNELRAARLLFALVALLNFLLGAVIIAQAALLSAVINRVFLLGADMNAVQGTLGLLAVCVALRALLVWSAHVNAARLALAVKARLRVRLLRHLAALGPAYTAGARTGELVTTAGDGVEALDPYFRDYLPGVLQAALLPVLILLVVLPLDGLTFGVLLLTAPLIPFFMALIGRAAGTLAQRQHAALSLLGAHFLDVLQGLTTLKLFNRSVRQAEVIARVTGDFRAATMRVLRVAFLSALTLELLATLSVAVVAVEIAVRLLYGGIGFESALFLLVIAPEFYQPLRALGARFHAGAAGTAAAERVYTLLDIPAPDRPASASTVSQPLPVRFENVSFAYENGARPALDSVTFEINPGERVALVGASGAGKSTCAALLLGFLVPDTGRITVGGTSLAQIDGDEWRAQVAWVAQSPHLFNASAAHNIALGRRGASPSEIEAAARAAEAHDFIAALPQGYDTPLGERGARLSGGQAQRVAIARAFLKDAPLLVLDEMTAHLDPQSEAAVQAALERLLRGRAALVIAHRLHTVARADRIVVLAQGRVAEIGTHTELMARGGVYQTLAAALAQA